MGPPHVLDFMIVPPRFVMAFRELSGLLLELIVFLVAIRFAEFAVRLPLWRLRSHFFRLHCRFNSIQDNTDVAVS